MKPWAWILGIGGALLAVYFYMQSTAQATANTSELQDELYDLQQGQNNAALAGLGVSGMGAASSLVSMFSNLFSSTPTVSSNTGGGDGFAADLGSTSDYYTDYGTSVGSDFDF